MLPQNWKIGSVKKIFTISNFQRKDFSVYIDFFHGRNINDTEL